MIKAADFKKQISKTLSTNLRALGFKGSGFDYRMLSNDFIFVIGIQTSRLGDDFFAEFGIQPKQITGIGTYEINFKKFKYYNCEFRTTLLNKNGTGSTWKFSDDPLKNVEMANDISLIVKTEIIPIIDAFLHEPYILDSIEVNDLNDIANNLPAKMGGMQLTTSDIRMAWALAMVYEKRDIQKAKEFAEFGLSKLRFRSSFMGTPDLRRIIKL
jgi:hypothetical protein